MWLHRGQRPPETLKNRPERRVGFTLNVGSSMRGHVEKGITVPSNDPTTPSVELTIQAHMTSPFDFAPQRIALRDMRQGAITNVAVLVKRPTARSWSFPKLRRA